MYTSKPNSWAVIDNIKVLSDCSFNWSPWFKFCFNNVVTNPENFLNFCAAENWLPSYTGPTRCMEQFWPLSFEIGLDLTLGKAWGLGLCLEKFYCRQVGGRMNTRTLQAYAIRWFNSCKWTFEIHEVQKY